MLWFCACFRVMLTSPAGRFLLAERRLRRCTKGVHVLFGEQAVLTGERRVATGELRSEKRLRSGALARNRLAVFPHCHYGSLTFRPCTCRKTERFRLEEVQAPALYAYLRCGRCCGT